MNKNKEVLNFIIIPGNIFIVFVCIIMLKISHYLNWSWWFILSPIIIASAISLYCFIKKS